MTAPTTPTPFDLCGPLPHGRLAIEASAGTGKTFTLAGLAARYVVEDQVRTSELLVVTFTRAAAAELRDRVRARLVEVLDALRRPEPPAPTDDPLLALLAATDRDTRTALVAQAVADFDAATITTIHGFAQQVLATLGTAAPGDLDATLVDDTVLLVNQVATDRLAAAAVAGRIATGLLPSVDALTKASMTVLGNPGIGVVPTAAEAAGTPPDDDAAGWLVLRRLVDEVVDEVHRRRRAAGTLAFDDVLTQLRDALTGPASAAPLEALRRRFRVALIDEFQDTDPVQWDIFRALFGDDGGSTLVLVGDPKQAIYAFRGANVHTYLDAATAPGTAQSTLATNWRSDGAVLHGLESLLTGATFGDPRIAFLPVAPAPGHEDRRLHGAGGAPLPALDLRLAIGPGIGRARSRNGKDPGARDVVTGDAERAIGDDLGRRVVELLTHATLPGPDGGPGRPVRPGDIAVLVGSHAEAATFLDRLRAHGVPAVVARGASVLTSPAATHWRWLLEALDQPHVPNRARTAALSWFEGWTPARLDAATDDDLATVADHLYRWADTLAAHGVVELCRQLWSDTGVAGRVLATPTGDRDLTDLEHIAELLQAGAAGRRLTPAGLLGVLAQVAAQRDDTDPDNDVAARRTESEAEAVQIMTVWASKGLEFPVVCVPTMWRASYATPKQTIFQDPATGGRTFDLTAGGAWPDADAGRLRKELAAAESVGENLRLLYVALTRARHQAVVWWTRAPRARTTGLSRLLFARTEAGTIDPEVFAGDTGPDLPADDVLLDALGGWLPAAGGPVDLTAVDVATGPPPTWTDPSTGGTADALAVAALGRTLPRDRHRWSFTTISARAHLDGIDPFDESLGEQGAGDEGAAATDPDEQTGSAGPDGAPALPLGSIAGGAEFGTLVHDVLEHVDFAADDLDAELRAPIEDRLRWSRWPVTADELVAGLRAAIETPLGPPFADRRLRDLGRADRLDELGFELTLGEGGRVATDRAIGELVLAHLPADDPLRGWAERLAGGLFAVDLAGHLTGSIDAVFRVHGADGTPRFVVCDYKTNALGRRGRPATPDDYHPDRLPAAMAEHHYPLQALLYTVALHRYLRWRLVGYDPARHLGGVAYLFLRGLAGPDTPSVGGIPHGLFAWDVPAGLVTALSDLLDGRVGPGPAGAETRPRAGVPA